MVSQSRRWMLVAVAWRSRRAAVAEADRRSRSRQRRRPARHRSVLTDADYARAEQYMTYNTTPLVLRSGVRPAFLPDGRFWYRDHDGQRAARRSSSIRSKAPKARAICRPAPKPAGGRRRTRRRPAAGGRAGRGAQTTCPSPDGKQSVFIRDWNLWVRDVASGKETRADDRRRQGLRLRHRQCRLVARATGRSWCGRPTRSRSRPSSRISATSARCTWSAPRPGIRSCRPGSIRCPATRWSR